MKKIKEKTIPIPEYPKTIETFKKIGDWQLNDMEQREISCFNGIVEVEKYRITVEKIEEPIDVIQQRLETLWVLSDNHHHYNPLKNKAKQFNYEFKGDFGSQKPKK